MCEHECHALPRADDAWRGGASCVGAPSCRVIKPPPMHAFTLRCRAVMRCPRRHMHACRLSRAFGIQDGGACSKGSKSKSRMVAAAPGHTHMRTFCNHFLPALPQGKPFGFVMRLQEHLQPVYRGRGCPADGSSKGCAPRGTKTKKTWGPASLRQAGRRVACADDPSGALPPDTKTL